MTEDYKKHITERIKDRVNHWIEELKGKHPELLLTKQWRILWPKGFTEGQNVIPVVTSSKQGKYLVGQVQFVLPQDLELDMDAVELVLKDEPYQVDQVASVKAPVPLDDPLDLLNDLVVGINGFLQSLNITVPTAGPAEIFKNPLIPRENRGNPLPIHRPGEPTSARLSITELESVDEVKRQMRRSPHLPDWYGSIYSKEVADDLLRKLSEGYIHYQRQLGRSVSLEEYFKRYTDYLQKEGKLHHYCRYKGKPVRLDSDDWCTETYCSKKPFNSQCPQTTLRFGAPPED